jgi:hypothetical protein
MVHSCASGFSTTRGISWATHRATLLIPTCVCVQTVVVNSAFYFDTRYVRVPFVAIFAGTDWFVVDDSAESMVPAGTWIFANFIYAGITFSAFVIS